MTANVMDIESKAQTILFAAAVAEMGSGKYEVWPPAPIAKINAWIMWV